MGKIWFLQEMLKKTLHIDLSDTEDIEWDLIIF